MIHLKTGEGMPSVLLLFVTKCIILHRIQYHVSRFEHQNIPCILAETPFMVLRRYIMLIRSFSKGRPILQIFYFQKSPMLLNSVGHSWWL
jgi:polysaccharide pyruvyl transferase WcaK-like protein